MLNTRTIVPAACLAGILGLGGVASGGPEPHTQAGAKAQSEEPAAEARKAPLGLGETMPDFKLKDADGKEVTLAQALREGPVVVTFYRGKWCPYCVKALESLEQSVSEVNDLGATVYAISPQTPEDTVDLREQTGLSYELLVDHDNTLAARLGLMFTLDADTVERYRGYGIDVPKSNGTDTWQLPIPATYVIDTDGVVRYAWTDADYRKRAPVEKILKALSEINGG